MTITATAEIGASVLPRIFTPEPRPDGKVLVRGVPIFLDHVRDLGDGRKIQITLSWLKQACLNHRRDETRDGYSPPLFLGHNDYRGKEDRPNVGAFTAPRILRAYYKGQAHWVACMDFLYRDLAAYQEAKKWPYRSVEVDVGSEPSFDGLALLASRPPFIQFANAEYDESKLGTLHYSGPRGDKVLGFWDDPILYEGETAMQYSPPPNGQAPPQQGGAESSDSKLDKVISMIGQLLTLFQPATQTAPVAAPAPAMQSAAAPKALVQASATGEPEKQKKPRCPCGSGAKFKKCCGASPEMKAQYAAERAAKQAAKSAPVAPVTVPQNGTAKPGEKPMLYEAATAGLQLAQKARERLEAKAQEANELFGWAKKELAQYPIEDEEIKTLVQKNAQYGRNAIEAAVGAIKTALPPLPGQELHYDASATPTQVQQAKRAQDELGAAMAKHNPGSDPDLASYLALQYEGFQRVIKSRYPDRTFEQSLENDPNLLAFAAQKGR